jgi:hypothetical protein
MMVATKAVTMDIPIAFLKQSMEMCVMQMQKHTIKQDTHPWIDLFGGIKPF